MEQEAPPEHRRGRETDRTSAQASEHRPLGKPRETVGPQSYGD